MSFGLLKMENKPSLSSEDLAKSSRKTELVTVSTGISINVKQKLAPDHGVK